MRIERNAHRDYTRTTQGPCPDLPSVAGRRPLRALPRAVLPLWAGSSYIVLPGLSECGVTSH